MYAVRKPHSVLIRMSLKQNSSQFSTKTGKNKPTEEWQCGVIIQRGGGRGRDCYGARGGGRGMMWKETE